MLDKKEKPKTFFPRSAMHAPKKEGFWLLLGRDTGSARGRGHHGRAAGEYIAGEGTVLACIQVKNRPFSRET